MIEMQVMERWPTGKTLAQQVFVSYGWVGAPPNPRTSGHALPVAGQYRLRMHYDDDSYDLHAVSNWVRIKVEDPTDEADIAVLDGLRRGVRWFDLRAAHPGSRYCSYDRLDTIDTRAARIKEGEDPDTGERVPVPRADLPAWRVARYREVISALEAEAERPGLLAREALSRARNLAEHIGDAARQATLEARLDAQHPGWRDIPDLH